MFSFAKNESLGLYRGILRELIRKYKFEKRRGLARLFASLILRYKKGFLERHTVLVPVPLTPSRLSERGFNQASLVAERIAGPSSILLIEGCLKRRGASKPQSSIGMGKERLEKRAGEGKHSRGAIPSQYPGIEGGAGFHSKQNKGYKGKNKKHVSNAHT